MKLLNEDVHSATNIIGQQFIYTTQFIQRDLYAPLVSAQDVMHENHAQRKNMNKMFLKIRTASNFYNMKMMNRYLKKWLMCLLLGFWSFEQ